MWMVNAFKIMGDQCFLNMRRPILLILAEHMMNSQKEAGGQRPVAPFREGRLEAAPIMCSPSIKNRWPPHILKHWPPIFKSIGQPHIIKAASH